jgi:hypothetical protein
MVGWSAARVERRSRHWRSARELAVDRDLWTAEIRYDRGYTEWLPDLAVWLDRDRAPVAVIAETGARREDRQKKILEGWRDAIIRGRYTGVHYDCASASVARWISRQARQVHLSDREFNATEQLRTNDIAALSPANDNTEPTDAPQSDPETAHLQGEQLQLAAVPTPAPPRPAPVQRTRAEPRPAPPLETPEAAAERERRYRQIMGIPEPKQRRWRRSA